MEQIKNFFVYNFYHINGANNRYLAFHIVGFMTAYFFLNEIGWNENLSLLFTTICAITWECKEFIIDHKADWLSVLLEYREQEFYWYDTIGDVLIPLVLTLVLL